MYRHLKLFVVADQIESDCVDLKDMIDSLDTIRLTSTSRVVRKLVLVPLEFQSQPCRILKNFTYKNGKDDLKSKCGSTAVG